MAEDIVSLSEIDLERYGVRIARATHVTKDNLASIIDYCHQNDIEMLIARCTVSSLDVAQSMEQEEFLLMDTLVYYSFYFNRSEIPENYSEIPVRFVRDGDAQQVEIVAHEAFKGYYGHYHADPRLDKIKSDEAYISWAVRSCLSREVADEVLIAEKDNNIVGFATLRLNSKEEGEGVLFGVSPEAQGQGIYRSFMINGMHWSKNQGAERMVVSTQVNNIAVQKVWARLGFTMSHGYYTFHKWFK